MPTFPRIDVSAANRADASATIVTPAPAATTTVRSAVATVELVVRRPPSRDGSQPRTGRTGGGSPWTSVGSFLAVASEHNDGVL